LVFGSTAILITGSGKIDRFQKDRIALIAESVAGNCILQADNSGDVPGVNLADLFPVIGVHPDQSSDALFGCRSRH
jgi:hypothetical protein